MLLHFVSFYFYFYKCVEQSVFINWKLYLWLQSLIMQSMTLLKCKVSVLKLNKGVITIDFIF